MFEPDSDRVRIVDQIGKAAIASPCEASPVRFGCRSFDGSFLNRPSRVKVRCKRLIQLQDFGSWGYVIHCVGFIFSMFGNPLARLRLKPTVAVCVTNPYAAPGS